MCIIKFVVVCPGLYIYVDVCVWESERGHSGFRLRSQTVWSFRTSYACEEGGGGVVVISSVSHHFLPSSILQGNARWPPDENLESLSQWRELTTKFHVKHAMITGQHKVKSYWKVMGIREMSFYDDNNRLESSLSSFELRKKEVSKVGLDFMTTPYSVR